MKALALAVAAGALALAGSAGAAPRSPLHATASISPPVHFVGDRVTARVEVVIDRRVVDPDGVHVTAAFGPYERTEDPTVERSRTGDLVRIVFRWPLACLGEDCLPRGQRLVRLRPARVTYGRHAVDVRWPPTAIVSRLGRIEVQLQRLERLASFMSAGQGISIVSAQAQLSPWRTNREPPAPSYRVSAPALGAGLLGGAALALAGAAVLVAPLVRRRRRRPPRAAPRHASSLAEALSLLAETMANGAGPPARREALERLARELIALERLELAARARRLAWSTEPPEDPAVGVLAREAEATGWDA